jgi:carbon-monoxide dehydrogenase large subunit
MAARYLGKPIRRNEDPRLLRGKALFVDDIDRAGMLHGAFLRSSHAHARIVKIDASRAVTVPGVAAVYTAHDLGNYWQSGPLLVPPPPIDGITFNQRTQVPLAKEVVRHVGEPIVLVIADSRYRAEDAVSVISVEYELLEP